MTEPSPPGSGQPPYAPPRRRPPRTVIFVAGAIALVVIAALTATVILVTTDGDGAESAGKASSPVVLREVTAVAEGPCQPGAGISSEELPPKCYQVTGGLTLTQVKTVKASLSKTSTSWTISIEMQPGDAKQFGALTQRMHNQPAPRNQLAIIIDQQVLSAPQILTPIPGGRIEISGKFTRDEAERLADRIAGRK